MTKFTVLITTYNRLSFLKRSVESVLKQTINCDLVVIDDCSTDGTEAYMRSLNNDRITYHRNDQNLGHSATLNLGVEISQSDWIKPLDDDDYLAPNCLAEISQAIEQYPSAVICSCQAAQVNPEGEELSITRSITSHPIWHIPQPDIHYGMLLEKVPFGTPVQVAFSRDAFRKSGGWDSSLDTNCDDIDSWVKIAQFGDAIFINKCLAYRTIWPGAYNQKFSFQKRLETNILIKEKIYNLVDPKYHNQLPKITDIRNYLRLHWSLAALKQKQVLDAIKIGLPAINSLGAWQLLLTAIRERRYN